MQTDANYFTCRTSKSWLGIYFVLNLILVIPTTGFCDVEKQPPRKPQPKKTAFVNIHQVEAVFVDGSKMKLAWLDDLVLHETPYGKLTIPVADIEKIEFGFRLTKQDNDRLQKAIKDLGSVDFKLREVATNDLLKLGAKAYPTLLDVSKSDQPEVARRVSKVLEKIKKDIPESLRKRPTHDVLFTKNSKITGRLLTVQLLTKTFQFGLQKMEIAHLRQLSLPPKPQDKTALVVLSDPGHLRAYQQHIAKTLAFRVTGAPPKTAGAWGTTVYTLDSRLAVAAVHAGVLESGQTATVRVIVLGPQPAFQASNQNGITSSPYGAYPGYQILPR